MRFTVNCSLAAAFLVFALVRAEPIPLVNPANYYNQTLGIDPAGLYDQAPGYGIVRIRKSTRQLPAIDDDARPRRFYRMKIVDLR